MKCRICNHDTRAIWDRQFQMDYFYCSHCAFLAGDDAKIVTVEREKEEYLTHNNSIRNEGYVNMFRNFVKKAILPHFDLGTGAPRYRALDYGCGPGDCVLGHVLEESGFDVEVYDLYFAHEPKCLETQYHLVTCTEVLEHLENPLAGLELLRDRLLPGGILAVMTLFHPILGNDGVGEDTFRNWWYRRDVTHISFFRPPTLAYMAEKIGLTMLMDDGRNTAAFKKAE